MRFTDYLDAEWCPALGCTEPAAVAWASALAAAEGRGALGSVRLLCDGRTFKNCYAVGIPNSGRKTGILWALAIGACLRDTSLGLKAFEGVTPEVLQEAQDLLDRQVVTVDVDPDAPELRIDVTVVREKGTGRALLEREHTNLTRLERDGELVGGEATGESAPKPSIRSQLGILNLADLVALAQTASSADRARLREGAEWNIAIARHGLSFLPKDFANPDSEDTRARLSGLVSAGVYARMSGEPLTVMSLAGSGNKGITVSVPLWLFGQEQGHPQAKVEEALALACLLTTTTTYHLGTLSAICGAANAAGIGIAGGLVYLGGGNANTISLAVNTMVGNLAGMICDGAKIGCAMKTMTGVDAAFRAATLALAGLGIPPTDGIVGLNGEGSLLNLGRVAQVGMASVDTEILGIMQDKLTKRA